MCQSSSPMKTQRVKKDDCTRLVCLELQQQTLTYATTKGFLPSLTNAISYIEHDLAKNRIWLDVHQLLVNYDYVYRKSTKTLSVQEVVVDHEHISAIAGRNAVREYLRHYARALGAKHVRIVTRPRQYISVLLWSHVKV